VAEDERYRQRALRTADRMARQSDADTRLTAWVGDS